MDGNAYALFTCREKGEYGSSSPSWEVSGGQSDVKVFICNYVVEIFLLIPSCGILGEICAA